MKRESGYYWVKVSSLCDWEISFWNGLYWLAWFMPSIQGSDSDLFEIDERRIIREESFTKQ